MRKITMFLLLVSTFMIACNDSDTNNRLPGGGSSLEPNQIQGGWDLVSSTGESESWYFDGSGRYIILTDDAMQQGTWRLEGSDMIIDEAVPQAVSLEGTLMQLGNKNLQRDESVKERLEGRLASQLQGTWNGNDGSTYTFVKKEDQQEYTSTFSDQENVPYNGTWELNGNKLILDGAQMLADRIYISGNILRWGGAEYRREGSAPATSSGADPVRNPNIPGEAIAKHSIRTRLKTYGEVIFTPYWEDKFDDSRVSFYLVKGKDAVYEFPSFFDRSIGTFDGIQSTEATDLNGDGLTDFVVMADFNQNDRNGQMRINTVTGVYINQTTRFRLDEDLSRQINNDNSINTMSEALAALRGSGSSRSISQSRSATASTSGGSGSSTTNTSSQPQDPTTQPRSAGPDYSKYAGDNSICRIRVAALSEGVDRESFRKRLGDLGILTYEPADNGFTRVYLGKYIGKGTAYRILNKVKGKGYGSAFVVVEQDYLNTMRKSDPAYHTFQIASVRRVNMDRFNDLDEQFQGDVFLEYGKGRYRVSLGVYQKELYPYLEKEFSTMGQRLGYTGGFSKQIQ